VKTPSRLSRQILPDSPANAPPSTVTPKFSKAPRFSVSTPSTQPQHGSPSTPRPRFGLTQQEQREDVQEVQSQSDHEESSEPAQTFAEDRHGEDVIRRDWQESPHQSAKRRRVEATRHAESSDLPNTNTSSRFAIHSTQPSNSADARSASRPAFLKSSIPAEQPGEPLPDVFSPHKRGQRFVPGGMAAELQSWIFETGNAAVQNRRGIGYLAGENYAVTIQVHEISGDGPFFLYAETSDGVPQRVMLVEGNNTTGSKPPSIRNEDIIGIRSPIWTITMDGKDWTVGVDYKILS